MRPTWLLLHRFGVWLKDKNIRLLEDSGFESAVDDDGDPGDVQDARDQPYDDKDSGYEEEVNDKENEEPAWRTELDVEFMIANPVLVVDFPVLVHALGRAPAGGKPSAVISKRSFHRYHVVVFAYNVNCRGAWAIQALSVGSDHRAYFVTL
ncbi:Fc.00g031140.m01.CDS01 [Cosmosporella sp. VM-42]